MPTRFLAKLCLAPLLSCAAVAGCRSAATASLPRDPVRALATVESNLLDAESVRCFSDLRAEGVLTAELRCEHQLTRAGRVQIRVQGTFAGRPVDVHFASDGRTMRLRAAGELREAPAPADLREGILIGMTRMGWMHNVALLAMGGVPEGGDGKVREWLDTLGVAAGEDLELGGIPARALTFGIEVGGQLAGSAVLWTAVENGLPLERWQKLIFPEGEMRVTEVYRQLEVNGLLEWAAEE